MLWIVKRDGKRLGSFYCDEIVRLEGGIYAKTGRRIVGAIASGLGLTWEASNPTPKCPACYGSGKQPLGKPSEEGTFMASGRRPRWRP